MESSIKSPKIMPNAEEIEFKENFIERYKKLTDFEEFKKFCVDYADRIPRLIGKKIDDIESRIKKLHPSIRHIDIEIN